MKIDLDKLREVPFQVQITYTSLEGNKCVRVLTSKQKVTSNLEEAEGLADFELVQHRAIQKCAQLAVNKK